jgi:preprotein translocase subunit YajC
MARIASMMIDVISVAHRFCSPIAGRLMVCFMIFLVSGCVPPEETGSPGDQSFGGLMFYTLYFMLMGFFAYYYIVIRPGQQDEEAKKKFVKELKKNDEVCTTGGLVGRVAQVKNATIMLEIAPKLQVKVLASEVHKMPEIENSKVEKKD